MNAFKFLTILIIPILLGSCRLHDSEKDPCTLNSKLPPSKLFEGEQSYSQYEKYSSIFADPSFHWIERNENSDQKGPTVDRFEVRRTFLGHTGKLEYVFYFRRLAEMRFHPDNPGLFFNTARTHGLPASDGGELVAGHVRYWANGRRGEVDTLAVSDTRIIRSFQACIAAHD